VKEGCTCEAYSLYVPVKFKHIKQQWILFFDNTFAHGHFNLIWKYSYGNAHTVIFRESEYCIAYFKISIKIRYITIYIIKSDILIKMTIYILIPVFKLEQFFLKYNPWNYFN